MTTTKAFGPQQAAPARAVTGALVVAAATALLLPGGPPGAGVLVLTAVVLGVLGTVRGVPVRGWRLVHGTCALLLTTSAVLRDAPWLVAVDLLAAVALGSLALVPDRRTWPGLLAGAVEPLLALPRGLGWLGRGLRSAAALQRVGELRGAGRGVLLTLGLLVVFVPLLTSADAAFADLLGSLLPGADAIGELPARVLAFGIGGAVAAGAVSVLLRPPAEPVLAPPARELSRRSEHLLPLGVLAGLLTAFVLVQVQVAAGGREQVLEEAGLTYAEHARSGFWQLLAVTALVLGVVAAARRWAPGAPAWLLGVLCLLAVVVDGVALRRLGLYVEEYGLTRLRVGVVTTCLWLAVVLLLVVLVGRRHWFPHVVVLSAALSLLGLTAWDPERAIARSAVERGAGADIGYLSTLSADAAGALDGLDPRVIACVLQAITPGLSGWTSANLSRDRARGLLADAERC